jgi:hypothetical protein
MSRDVVRPRVTIVFSGFFYLGRWAWPLASHPAAWISRHRRARIFFVFLKKNKLVKNFLFLNRLSQFDTTYKQVAPYTLTRLNFTWTFGATLIRSFLPHVNATFFFQPECAIT